MNVWSAFITIMIQSLIYIYNLVGQNFGWAIIIFTVLIKVITYPLTAGQLKSSKAMQELQGSKKWADIQKKYKDDKEKLAQKQMELYQEMGISPFGSCLPLLIQFPIIIGLYQSIIRTLAVTPIELLNLSQHISSGATLIPINSQFLWISELSNPERWIIPGTSFGIPVLAILVVITSYISTAMITPSAQDSSQGAQMNQSMTLMMPLFSGWIAYTFSAGLALYFLATNLATLIQYILMGRADFTNIIPRLPGRSSS